MKKQPILFLFLITLAEKAFSVGVINSGDLFDSLVTRFANTASFWGDKMLSYGNWLFWGLALISMTWTYGLMALRKADLQEFFLETIRFFTTLGFFFFLLENAPALSTAIMDSLREIASKATGLDKLLSPSSIVDIGFDIVSKVADKSSIWSPATSTVGIIVAGLILLCLVMIATNLLIILITGWILAYGGIFLLGFGGGRWTEDIAINYYRTVLATGVQMFAMTLIVGIGKSFIDEFYLDMTNEMAIKELFIILAVSVCLLTLVDKIPPKFAAIVGGGGGGGGGGMGLSGAMATAAAGLSVASSAAHAGLGGAMSLAGGGAALKAAFESAQSLSSKSSPSRLSEGLTGALGEGVKLATHTASALGAGMAQLAKEGIQSASDSMGASIANTTGGKVAKAIRDNVKGEADGANNSVSASIFEGNSISSGVTETNTNAQPSKEDGGKS